MSINYIDELIMPIITAACLCIGYVMKKWLPADDKWIPTVLLIVGAVSGLILFGVDYEGIVKGMVSGLAAVGLHQVFKQHLKLETEYKENQLLMAEAMLAEDEQELIKGDNE